MVDLEWERTARFRWGCLALQLNDCLVQILPAGSALTFALTWMKHLCPFLRSLITTIEGHELFFWRFAKGSSMEELRLPFDARRFLCMVLSLKEQSGSLERRCPEAHHSLNLVAFIRNEFENVPGAISRRISDALFAASRRHFGNTDTCLWFYACACFPGNISRLALSPLIVRQRRARTY